MRDNLERLAVKLDKAERDMNLAEDFEHERELWARLRKAKENYFDAIRAPWLAEQAELDRVKFARPTVRRIWRLREAVKAARERLAMLHAIGEELYLVRDLLDAEAAEEAAEGRLDFFESRMDEVRHLEWLFEQGAIKRPKPRVISDGFILTGYKTVDGQRVPVWEKCL